MAKLTKEEVIQICKERGYEVLNAEEYENLEATNLKMTCKEGHTFITSLKIVRDLKGFNCPQCDKQEVSYNRKPPMKRSGTYRIMAFDQATQNFGVSIYDSGKLVYYDVIHFIGGTEERLVDIAQFIAKSCKEWEPDYVMFEDIQLHAGAYNGYQTFKVLAELLGVVKVMLQIQGIRHSCVLNKVWQAHFGIGGKDRATQKANVIKKVKELFNIQVNDDIADAILIDKYASILHEQATKKVKMF